MEDQIEDLVMQTIECVEEFHLLELDETWMSEILCNDFANYEEHPESVDSIFPEDFADHLVRFLELLDKWVERSERGPETGNEITERSNLETSIVVDEVLWEVFSKNNIDVKSILCLLFMFCCRSVKQGASLYEKQLGLICARIYLTMLQVSGSTAYSVYHPCLVRVAVDCIKFPKAKAQSRKRSQNSVYRNEIASPRRRARRNRNTDDALDEADDVPEPQDAELTDQECEEIFVEFAAVLEALIKFLRNFSLKGDEETLDQITMKLVECTTCDVQHSDFDFCKSTQDICLLRRRYGIAYVVSALAYQGLLVLCAPLHGRPKNNYLNVLKHLSEHILCSKAKSPSNQTIPHRYVVLKDSAVSFVCYVLNEEHDYSIPCTKVLLQQLCIRVCDKSDFRSKVAHAIVKILSHFPCKEFAEMCEWFDKLVCQNKISERMIALEVASLLINEAVREIPDDMPPHLVPFTSRVPLAKAIIHRCQDKAPSVRTKALNILANNLKRVFAIIKGNSSTDTGECEGDISSSTSSLSMDSDCENSRLQTDQTPTSNNNNNNNNNQNPVPAADADEIFNELHFTLTCRLADDKVHARRAALLVTEALICLEEKYLHEDVLDFFFDAAHDRNVAVRKTCLSSISNILEAHPGDPRTQKAWIKCVLPLVLDAEKTVQAKCLEAVETQFVVNISGSPTERNCAWSMLNEIASSRENLQRLLFKAFSALKSEGRLRPNLCTAIEQEIGAENNAAAWLLLSIWTKETDVKKVSFVVEHWEMCVNDSVHWLTARNILEVIGNCAKNIPAQNLGSIQTSLEMWIQSYRWPMELIASAIETLFRIYEVQSLRDDTYQRLSTAFSSETMKAIEKFLMSAMQEKNPALYSELEICKNLHTFGELALMCPSCVPKKAVLIIQSIVTPPSVVSMTDENSGALNGNSQSQKLPQERSWPAVVQAVAVVALGKLCLLNEDLTKKWVQLLACRLKNTEDPVIRDNIIVVLCDLCVRYTSVVDLYIPTITECLKDSNVQIRHQTLTLIASLLQEGYIKLKDSLFYRMLATVVDERESVSLLAEYCFENIIIKKNESIFVQNFVECLYFFNAYFETGARKFTNIEKDKEIFALPGKSNQEKRMGIYKFVLKHTSMSDRFAITLKLWKEIMGGFSENIIPLNSRSEVVLQDCMFVLCCEEIKLPSAHSTSADDDEEHEVAEFVVEKVVNRTVLIPLIIQISPKLKSVLLDAHSALANDLDRVLNEVFKEYRNEIKDMFPSDKTTRSEIEFDIRKFENQFRTMPIEDTDNEDDVCATPSANNRARADVGLLKSAERSKTVTRRIGMRNGMIMCLPSRNNPHSASGRDKRTVRLLNAFQRAYSSNSKTGRNVRSPVHLPPEPSSSSSEHSSQPVVCLQRLCMDDIMFDNLNSSSQPESQDPSSATLHKDAEEQNTCSTAPSSSSENGDGVCEAPDVQQKRTCRRAVVVLTKLEPDPCANGSTVASTPINRTRHHPLLPCPDISDIHSSAAVSNSSSPSATPSSSNCDDDVMKS